MDPQLVVQIESVKTMPMYNESTKLLCKQDRRWIVEKPSATLDS